MDSTRASASIPVGPDHQPGPGSGYGLSQRALRRAQAYIEARLDQPLSLDDIARAACLSRAHFARMFRISTGCSVMSYVYRLRIERARAILIENPVALAELSFALGFSHQSHFTRVFRRFTGLNPGEFVRRHAVGRDGPPPAAPGDAPEKYRTQSQKTAPPCKSPGDEDCTIACTP